jgi:hypothetical protein
MERCLRGPRRSILYQELFGVLVNITFTNIQRLMRPKANSLSGFKRLNNATPGTVELESVGTVLKIKEGFGCTLGPLGTPIFSIISSESEGFGDHLLIAASVIKAAFMTAKMPLAASLWPIFGLTCY